MRINLFFIGFIGLLLSACSVKGTWIDDRIPPDTQAEVGALNKQLIEAIRSNNPDKVRSLLSKPLLNRKGSSIPEFLNLLNQVVGKSPFVSAHRFYQNGSKSGETIILTKDLTGDHGFTISYPGQNEESYAILGYYDQPEDQPSLFVAWSKYPEGWKIDILQANKYSIQKKDAFTLYAESRRLYEKGHYVDAALNGIYVDAMLDPSNGYMHYRKEAEMKQFLQRTNQKVQATYAFPYTCEAVSTQPQILNIDKYMVEGHYAPVVTYVSKATFDDEAAMDAECSALHAIIGKIYPGLDQNNKKIYYTAFDRMPQNDGDQPRGYNTVRETRK